MSARKLTAPSRREFTDVADAMLAVADRAYASRISEYVDYQVELCRTFYPDLFVVLDIDSFRKHVERELRASELDDLWSVKALIEHAGGDGDA